jgi:hypothetical protein
MKNGTTPAERLPAEDDSPARSAVLVDEALASIRTQFIRDPSAIDRLPARGAGA